jgi:hypothetical protein
VIRDLIKEGMRIVVETARERRKLQAEHRKLQASIQELTNSLKRGANRHGKRKLDINKSGR